MKTVVLAQDSQSTWMMVNALRADYPELQVLLETAPSRLAMLRRRAARKGIWTVFGQLVFMLLVPLLCWRGRARRRELLVGAGLTVQQPAGVKVTRFESVNSEACIKWLAAEQPDVVVVNGTRIIAPAVLGACDAKFLNTHCGITPAYRGVHGGYWALFQGDRANCGVTVHLVNSGIDTGNIVYQHVIQSDREDCFLTYPLKQYIAGVPLMRRAIADFAAGKLHTVCRDDLPSALWQHPTLWQYLWARWSRGVR